MMTLTKQCQRSNINDDGDDSYGEDSNADGDGNGDGNGDDVAAIANGNNVDEASSGIQGRQLDDGDRMTRMGQRWCTLTIWRQWQWRRRQWQQWQQ
jgi:hypothetical protein